MRQFMKLLVTSWDPNRSRPTHTYRPIYDFILLSLKIKGLSQVDGVGHIRFICWSFSYYVRKLGLHLHSLSLSHAHIRNSMYSLWTLFVDDP
jgi:hypothetical protein